MHVVDNHSRKLGADGVQAIDRLGDASNLAHTEENRQHNTVGFTCQQHRVRDHEQGRRVDHHEVEFRLQLLLQNPPPVANERLPRGHVPLARGQDRQTGNRRLPHRTLQVAFSPKEFAQPRRIGKVEEEVGGRGLHIAVDQECPEAGPCETDCQVAGKGRLALTRHRTRDHQNAQTGAFLAGMRQHDSSRIDRLDHRYVGVVGRRDAAARRQWRDRPDEPRAEFRRDFLGSRHPPAAVFPHHQPAEAEHECPQPGHQRVLQSPVAFDSVDEVGFLGCLDTRRRI